MGLRVLLIEDNPDHALLTSWALERDAHVDSVEVAGDPGSVVARLLAQDTAALPDAILVDLRLPGLSGFDLLEALKAEGATREIPVIILSTSAREEEIARGMSAGARAFLTKPLTAPRFLEALGPLPRRG
jgi:CheY-like chemotaxis protein